MRFTTSASLLVALGLIAGCSFVSVRGPSGERRAGVEPSCRVSRGSVAADVLFATGGAALALGGDESGLVIGGVIGALYAGSALYGVSGNRRCTTARSAYDAELAEVERELEQRARLDEVRERERARDVVRAPIVTGPPVTVPPVVGARAAAATREPDDDDAGDVALQDPFSNPPSDADDTDDPDDDDDDGDVADDDSDTGADPVAVELRWREFWRRLP